MTFSVWAAYDKKHYHASRPGRRRLTEAIKREWRRRSAVEPVIGHATAERGIGRNFLRGVHDDAANAALAAQRPARNPSSSSTTPEAQTPPRAPNQAAAFFTVDFEARAQLACRRRGLPPPDS